MTDAKRCDYPGCAEMAIAQCECCLESRNFCPDHGSPGGDVVQEGYADTCRPSTCWYWCSLIYGFLPIVIVIGATVAWFVSMRDENSYSPEMPATTKTAKNILRGFLHVLSQDAAGCSLDDAPLDKNHAFGSGGASFFSKNGSTTYSPRIPIARTNVDRPDQMLSDFMIASSSSLSINPRYAYAIRGKWDWMVIGLLGIGLIVRVIYQ